MGESYRFANSTATPPYDQWWQIITKYTKTANTWVCPTFTRNGRYVADMGDNAFQGGGYAHALPRVGTGTIRAPLTLRLGDPHQHAAFAPQLHKYAFATGISHDSAGTLLGANKLSSVKGRRVLKYEQYPLLGADMGSRGDLRHTARSPNGNIQPAGGSIVWTDGSVTWSKKMEIVWPWSTTTMMVVPED
jgi:hypothetical protein